MGGLPWDVAARDLPVPEAISQRRAALGIPQATPRAQEAPPQAAKRGQGQACGDGQTAPDTQDQSTKRSKSVYNIISTQGWINEAYRDYLQDMREEQRAVMTKPTKEQMKVESIFPAIAKYVRGYGYVEIGNQESFGFVVRALGYGGLDFEDDTPETLAEAMVVLEAGLSKWFKEQGIELN